MSFHFLLLVALLVTFLLFACGTGQWNLSLQEKKNLKRTHESVYKTVGLFNKNGIELACKPANTPLRYIIIQHASIWIRTVRCIADGSGCDRKTIKTWWCPRRSVDRTVPASRLNCECKTWFATGTFWLWEDYLTEWDAWTEKPWLRATYSTPPNAPPTGQV